MLRLLFCSLWVCGSLLGSASASSKPTSRYERGPSKERVIVFVHGFRGDADSTWTSSNGAYWPQLLLQDSTFDDFDIYVVNYPAHLGGSSTIEDIVSSLYSRLKGDNVTQHRNITFVCHSLSGIVTERLLLDHPEVAARVSFVYLLGTPLTGSAVANYVSVFGSNPVTHALHDGQDNDSLQLLENHWKAYDSKIVRYCGYEKKPWAGLGFIVDRQSATRDCDHEVAIDGDHQGIAKPSDRRELSYIGLVNAVRDHPILTDQTGRTVPAPSPTVKDNPPAKQTLTPGPPPSAKVTGNGPPATAQQPQPTYSVTNPSGSIINQGSKVDAPQTINNYAPPRRVISPTENEEARKVLLASPEKHKPLLLINGGDETQAFALQLASIFESSNWPLFGGGAARSDSFAPIGYEVELCVYPGNAWAMDDAKVIREAFSKAGIKAPIIEDERMNAEPDKVYILVFPIQDGISK